jgi:BirA family transcriptional regulator, biotin operon repressor / biotin---[acetyl-CoA-carboxylase] ligase
VSDSLAPAAVEPLLTGRFGRPYLHREVCESTQGLLEPSGPEGATATCEEQTAGRGRLGRAWTAPPGTAILCSVLVHPPPERRVQELSLVAGIAVANTVEAVLDLAVQIKWPNDVLVDRRKVAGVLAEARDGTVTVGIGLNVNQRRDELPRTESPEAASLLTVDGVRRERPPILALLLGELEGAYDRWLEVGLDALYVELAPRDFLRGRPLVVDGVKGVGAGIDRSGRLLLDMGEERRAIESGDVSYQR